MTQEFFNTNKKEIQKGLISANSELSMIKAVETENSSKKESARQTASRLAIEVLLLDKDVFKGNAFNYEKLTGISEFKATPAFRTACNDSLVVFQKLQNKESLEDFFTNGVDIKGKRILAVSAYAKALRSKAKEEKDTVKEANADFDSVVEIAFSDCKNNGEYPDITTTEGLTHKERAELYIKGLPLIEEQKIKREKAKALEDINKAYDLIMDSMITGLLSPELISNLLSVATLSTPTSVDNKKKKIA